MIPEDVPAAGAADAPAATAGEERLRRDVPTEEALAWRDGAFEHAEGPMAAPGSPRLRRHAAAAAELRPTAAALAWRAAAFSHAEQPMAIPMPDDGERGAGPPQVGARAHRGPQGPRSNQ